MDNSYLIQYYDTQNELKLPTFSEIMYLIKAKVLLLQAIVILDEFGFPVYILLITCSQGLLNYLAFLFMSFSSLFNKSFQ
jgi:hypothetical protein